MTLDYSSQTLEPGGAIRYRVFRTLIRLQIALSFKKMRVLAPEPMPAAGALLVALNHPPDCSSAITLVAALERRVHCLLSRESLRGVWRRLLGWGLGMIAYDAGDEAERRAAGAAREILGGGEAVAIFLETHSAVEGEGRDLFRRVATPALETEARGVAERGLAVIPVHLFVPPEPLKAEETLVYIARALEPARVPTDGKTPIEHARILWETLREACSKNVFRLQPEDLVILLAGLEEVLRADLEEDWAARTNWKQNVEGFELSGFVKKWANQVNFSCPAELVALGELLNEYREQRRSTALRCFEVDSAGAWVNSFWRSAAVWFESVVGFPIALYGSLNHLLVLLVLHAAGVLRKEASVERAGKWITFGLAVGFWYVIQILACEHWLGRALTGYYALSLPISGAYAYRYFSFVRHGARTLWLRIWGRRDNRKLRRCRKRLVRELEIACGVSLEAAGFSR